MHRVPGLWRCLPLRRDPIRSGDGRAEKCTLCSHRIDQGLEPFCAKECIWGALRFTNTEGAENHS